MFSIIIPVGPHRDAAPALDSLLAAGLSEGDEVIVVTDGHVMKFEERYSSLPVRTIPIFPQKGANAARNHGALVAVNPVLCFLDDDDSYVEDALQVVKKWIQKMPKVDVWVLNWNCLSGKKPFFNFYPKIITERKIWKRNRAGGASSMVLRKEAFTAAGGFDESMAAMQDWDLWIRLSRIYTIHRIPEPLVTYNDIGANRISTSHSARVDGLESLLRKNTKFWPASVRAFHKARLAAEKRATSDSRRKVFQVRAPLASLYFALRH